MKCLNTVAIAVTCIALSACAATRADPGPSDLAGSWEEETLRPGSQMPYSVLTVELRVSGRKIAGSYCFVTRFGKKIDCDPDSGDNLGGVVNPDGSATISFDSTFGAEGGKAVLTSRGDEMEWTTVEPPTGGDFYGPESALLQRVGH
ncbi:hypothetical protein [Lysobacter sp. F60174L2]|uniref:hypothetical protein n=1 Tax=Lysobacter sp. F60174L2 TaxID=3459295 RepID=UPI00403D5738